MVLAVSNRPFELDGTILRPFTCIFEIGVHVCCERSKILQVVLKGENVEPNIDYGYIAILCDGFIGSFILELCKQTAFYPIREILSSEKDWMIPDLKAPDSIRSGERFLIIQKGKEGCEQYNVRSIVTYVDSVVRS